MRGEKYEMSAEVWSQVLKGRGYLGSLYIDGV